MMEKLSQALMVLKNVYDEINVIDPINKKVLLDKNCKVVNKGFCYKSCGGGTACINCIGMRAYNEEKSFIKLNFDGENLAVITAIPILESNKKYIIEAIKIADEPLFLDGIKFNDKDELKRYIENINNSIVKDEETETFNCRYAYEMLPADIEFSRVNNSRISIALLDLEFAHDAENEFMKDMDIFNIISVVSANMDQEYDWISRIEDKKFLIIIKRDSDHQCTRVYNTIIEELEKKSTEYKDTKFTLYTYDCGSELYDLVYDSKRLLEQIITNIKR